MSALELLVLVLMVVVAVLVLLVERRSRQEAVTAPAEPYDTPVVRGGKLVIPAAGDRCWCVRCQMFREAHALVVSRGGRFVQVTFDEVRA